MPISRKVIAVENINIPGSTSNVNAEKYEVMRGVLLKVLPNTPLGLTQTEMIAFARDQQKIPSF